MNTVINQEDNEFIVKIPAYRGTYINRILKLKCFEELQEVFASSHFAAKEVTESYAAYEHLNKFCNLNDYNFIHVADGSRGRTAALFSFLTKTFNYAIDPLINEEKCNSWMDKWTVDRFAYFKEKVEDVPLDSWYKGKTPICVTAVHSHVDLTTIDKAIGRWHYMYANPCCKELSFSKQYMRENNIKLIYQKTDYEILSPQRKIKVYYKNL